MEKSSINGGLYMKKTSLNGGFSLAMFDYQSVTPYFWGSIMVKDRFIP
jgi:hypothetical protein